MRRFLKEQNLFLLLSFVIAVTLWYYVASPRTARVQQMIARTVAVVPAITGEPAHGYSLIGIRVTPQTIVITGEPRLVAQVQNVTTEPVNIAGATRDFVQEMAVVGPPELNVTGRVRVAVQVAPAVAVTTVRGIRVQVPTPPTGMTVEVQPDLVRVEVQGPVTVVNRLRAGDFTARIDGVEFSEGRQRVQITVQAPPQIEVLSITPPSVMIIVRRGG